MKWLLKIGVLFDRRLNKRLKSTIKSSVIRPVAFYCSERWFDSKDNERPLSLMEMKMLLWISGVIHYYHINIWGYNQCGKIAIALRQTH